LVLAAPLAQLVVEFLVGKGTLSDWHDRRLDRSDVSGEELLAEPFDATLAAVVLDGVRVPEPAAFPTGVESISRPPGPRPM